MDTRDFISIKYHRDWNFSTPIQTINYLIIGGVQFQADHNIRNREATVIAFNRRFIIPLVWKKKN